jgi:predicted permease
MPWIRPRVRRLFDLTLRRRDVARRDVDAEVSLHLELRVEQLVQKGMARPDALREAERRFGVLNSTLPVLEEIAHRRNRRMSLREWLDSVGQDVRYALRGLRREPAFAGFAIVTLALGIGANAAMYGVVDRLLLRGPDHVRDPERVVRLTTTVPRRAGGEVTFSAAGYVLYDHLRQSTALFDGVAAYEREGFRLGERGEARFISGVAATAGFFELSGVRPHLGRFFTPDEDDVNTPAPVVVLGDALWRSQFAGDPSIIGRTIRMDDRPFTVIGIAPAGFTGVELGRVDAWVPMSLLAQDATTNWTRAWNAQWLFIVGRLKLGATLAAASEDATRAHLTTYDGPATSQMARARIGAAPLRFTESGRETTEAAVSRWLIGVTVVVLLIACSNVANLLLSRAVRRRGEIGVRLALGASRRRLVRLFMTESLAIGTLGGLASLAVAGALATLIRTSLLPQIEWTASPVSGRVLLLSLIVTLVVGLLVGVAPAAHALRSSVQHVLQRGRTSRGGVGASAWPTVLQATLTACLLIGAGLFVQSLHRARTTPLGFEADRILVADAEWARDGASSDAELATRRALRGEVLRRALEVIRAHPDVERAAIAIGTPFGSSYAVPVRVPGFDSLPRLPGGGPYVAAVTGDYFQTVGTRLVRGRLFTPDEGRGTEAVAIVNETMARTLWPQQDAIGRCFHLWSDTLPCARVVGVVEPARRYELQEEPSMQYYIPLGQESGFGGPSVMIRPRGSLPAFAPIAVRILRETDASVESARAYPMRESIDPLLRPWKLGATIFSLGGALALLVGALGLYAVMSYSVAQRTHEMGVRIALGAGSRHIVGLVVRQAVMLAAIGIAGGMVIAVLAGRRLQDLLYQTSSHDVRVLSAAAIVLLGSAIMASFWPALRAGRVDPMRALKTD